MQLKQDILISEEDENALENFVPYENEESILEDQDIERDHRNLVEESSDTESRVRDVLLGHISQAELLGSELSSFLRKIRFSDQEFAAGIPVSNIKYNHL